MNQITEQAYPHLASAGYEFSKSGVRAPGACPGDTIRNSDMLDKLEGRLSNVEYMAHAIDIFDVARTTIKGTPAGKEQFRHLMNPDRELHWHGYLYVALRRFQREGRNDALRAGLALLVAVEQGIIAGRDAVQAMAPDLVQMHDIRHDDGGKALERQRQLPSAG